MKRSLRLSSCWYGVFVVVAVVIMGMKGQERRTEVF